MLVLCLSFSIVLLDQITKYLIRYYLRLGDPAQVIRDFFNLCYIQNTGAAWGKLQGFNSLLIVLSVVILFVIVVFRRSLLTEQLIHRVAAGLIIGGIASNLIDRLRLGYVVDFLDFYWKSLPHFPAFNVADASICIGVGLYILSQIRGGNRVQSTE